jgi:hypothetical protein
MNCSHSFKVDRKRRGRRHWPAVAGRRHEAVPGSPAKPLVKLISTFFAPLLPCVDRSTRPAATYSPVKGSIEVMHHISIRSVLARTFQIPLRPATIPQSNASSRLLPSTQHASTPMSKATFSTSSALQKKSKGRKPEKRISTSFCPSIRPQTTHCTSSRSPVYAARTSKPFLVVHQKTR